MQTRLNVFVVETRFQALVSLLIARSQPDADSLIVYYLPNIGPFVDRFRFVRGLYVDPSEGRFLFARQRKIRRILQRVLREIRAYPAATTVDVYCAKFQGSLFNYYIRFLQDRLAGVRVRFNIITDGTFNFQRADVTDKDRAAMQKKVHSWKDRLFGLAFYPYEKERYGIEADVIEKIYLLPQSPHQYDPARVVDVPMVDLGIPQAATAAGGRSALVIGEKLTDKGYLTPADERAVSAQVADLLRARGIERVDFVPHPTATHPDLQEPHYHVVQTNDPVELRILEHPYAMVVGVASTALFTARLLRGSGCHTVSVGLQHCAGRNDLAHKIGEAFEGMGVEVIA